MDDNFATIVNVAKWGRSVYINIQKFVQFQLTVNIVALMINFISACISGEYIYWNKTFWWDFATKNGGKHVWDIFLFFLFCFSFFRKQKICLPNYSVQILIRFIFIFCFLFHYKKKAIIKLVNCYTKHVFKKVLEKNILLENIKKMFPNFENHFCSNLNKTNDVCLCFKK